MSQSGDSGSLKISISAHTPQDTPDKRKRKEKEFLSPSDESKIHVVNDASPDLKRTSTSATEKCSVSINFDMNTKKLWQELHYPYGNYTSFFRHLILLEKYWRSGDLVLSPTASAKPSAYLKSVQNRITSYEGKQLASQDDLSAVTRPDLSGPAPPKLVHTPGEAVLANLPVTSSPSPKLEASPGLRSPEASAGTILRIPRVPRSSGSLLSPSAPQAEGNSVTPSPKIRVRQDLMNHLGLVAAPRSAPASGLTVTSTPSAPPPTSHLRAALTVTPVSAPPTHSTPNLAKLLSDSPSSLPQASDPTGSPMDSAPIKSSNSQLFKSTESTGAIPLTFNNSIAEVLAAASKAKNAKSREPSPKPEITITAKSSNKTKDLSQVLAASNKASSNSPLVVTGPGHKLPASVSQGPSFGALSILKKSAAASSTASASPLSNMTKLLQAQTPGLPPHVIAQQTLPASNSAPKASKVMSRPPGPVMSNLRPVQLSSGGSKPAAPAQGIQTVNKKSLNTVLDRLGGLGTSSAPIKASASSVTSSSAASAASLASSLVQQLQAPPMTSRPQQKSFKDSTKSVKSSPATNVPMTSVPPGLTISVPPVIGQPMVQFPPGLDPGSLLSQSLLLGPNPAAAQAALMMAGLNGLSPAQAQAAMTELMQQQMLAQGGQQPRLRAPPPLKNMAGARKPE